MKLFMQFGTRPWHIVAVGVVGAIFTLFSVLLTRTIEPFYTFTVVNVTIVLITVGFVRNVQFICAEARRFLAETQRDEEEYERKE